MSRSDWKRHYESRMSTPEELVKLVSSGDRIYVPTVHESNLLPALIGRAGELKDVELRSLGGMWSHYGFESQELAPMLRANMSFGNPATRESINEGITEFTVTGFGDVYRHIDQGRPGSHEFDFCWFSVTPPNESGYVCVGADLWDVRTSMKRSRITMAAVNDCLPRTFGDTWIHVSEIDHFFAQDEPFAQRIPLEPSPDARAIAEHVKSLVRNGDTLQIGSGSTTGALVLAGAFDDKEDLGYFSELTAPGLIDLVRRGVITSKYATVHPNRFCTTGLTGYPDDYAYVDKNPFFEFYDYDYMLNPMIIGKNDNMVAINNALSVDLRGQIAVMSIGPTIYAGSGGQFSFHVGAYMSKGGRAITVLPSTAAKGAVSRIVSQFPAGQMVTVPWDLADTIVTEYGVADLLGKTIKQRAEALIAVAHPDFRSELRATVTGLG